MKPLYDVRAAARAIGISPRTVQSYIRDGKLNAVRIGGFVNIDEQELERFMLRRRRNRARRLRRVSVNSSMADETISVGSNGNPGSESVENPPDTLRREHLAGALFADHDTVCAEDEDVVLCDWPGEIKVQDLPTGQRFSQEDEDLEAALLGIKPHSMCDADQLLEMAKELLRERYHTLSKPVIDGLAHQAVVKPIDQALSETELKRELSKRITALVNSQFPHLTPKRLGRGGLITVGGAPPRGRERAGQDHQAEVDPESTRDIADARLSKCALASSGSAHSISIRRESEKAVDTVEEVFQRVSPTSRAVLEKVLEVSAPGDSLREIGRQTDLMPMQVSRAFKDARDVLEGKKLPRPVLSHTSDGSRKEGVEFNPPTVPAEHRWLIHGGAIISDIGIDHRSSTPSNGHSRQPRPKDIFSLPRPRRPDHVEHPTFGRGAVLQNRGDENVCVEFDKPGNDDKRRRIMRWDSLKLLNGKAKP
jgi:excisionase family DNA binding protein